MKCPACNRVEFKEARQCPLRSGEPVCSECCTKCRFYTNDIFLPRCTYYIAKQKKKQMETIEEKEMKLKVLTEEYEAKKKEGQLGTAVLLLREKLQLENWLKAHKENV